MLILTITFWRISIKYHHPNQYLQEKNDHKIIFVDLQPIWGTCTSHEKITKLWFKIKMEENWKLKIENSTPNIAWLSATAKYARMMWSLSVTISFLHSKDTKSKYSKIMCNNLPTLGSRGGRSKIRCRGCELFLKMN